MIPIDRVKVIIIGLIRTIARNWLNYFQTSYFSFFVPFFVIMAIYEMLLQYIRAKDLCAHILIVAKKL